MLRMLTLTSCRKIELFELVANIYSFVSFFAIISVAIFQMLVSSILDVLFACLSVSKTIAYCDALK